MKINLVPPLFFLIALFENSVAAQTPAPIDVKFIEISQDGVNPTRFTMRAINAAGQTISYFGADSAAIIGQFPFILCRPCSPPKVFETNIFRSQMTADIGQPGSGQVNFYFSESESSSLYLGNRFLSKREFPITGKVKVRGRVEVTGQNGFVVAVDNDVVLEGNYSVLYSKRYFHPTSGRRQTDFKSLIYILSAPEN